MKLSATQQDWADTFELSDSLVEDAAAATNYSTGTGAEPFNGIVCPNCWSNPCVCATDSVGEQADTPDEKNAEKNINLKDTATKTVAKDLRQKHNKKPDEVSFYPSTEEDGS